MNTYDLLPGVGAKHPDQKWPKQRYFVNLIPGGFQIHRENRNTVQIEHAGTFLKATSTSGSTRFGLFQYQRMVTWISEQMLQNVSFGIHSPHNWIPSWITTKTGKAINARIYPLWKEMLDRANPTVVAVQRRIFSATCKMASIAAEQELYDSEYLVKDILSYRAAAVAALWLPYLSRQHPWTKEEFPGDSIASRIGILSQWQRLYAVQGQPYTSLHKTLTRLPGNVAPMLLTNLHRIRLVRPIEDRVELMLLLAFLERGQCLHDTVFQHSSRENILRASHLVCSQTGNPASLRRTQDFRFLARYLADYPEVHRGNIVGLARKSIEWHRHAHKEKCLAGLDPNQAVLVPAIGLPQIDGVAFLGTVGAIVEEGQKMRHCVGKYASSAVRGECFLFHVDHEGDAATVEVSPRGYVAQACGPINCNNRATEWGQRVLAAWASGFPKTISEESQDHLLPF